MSAKLLLLLTALCIAGSLARAADDTEALKQRVLALARTVGPDDYAFTRTTRGEQIEGATKEQRTTVERFDPRRPAEQRWTLVSIDGKAPTAAETQSYAKGSAKRRSGHYGRSATYFGAPATTTTDDRGRVVFHFTALPKGSLMANDTDLSANATADATVDPSGAVPFVEQVRFTLVKPARVMLVAKVERLVVTNHFRMMPDGKPAPTEHVSETSGSMLGKTGQINSITTYSEVRPARE